MVFVESYSPPNQTVSLEKTLAALQMAGRNASHAHADADTAEACAAGLATQLQAMKTLVDETKQASQILY